MDKTLLLDKNYMALSLVPWKRALKLIVKGKAEGLAGSSTVRTISGAKGIFEVPSIIRLLTTVPWRAHSIKVKFSRKNVLTRDMHQCQYCGVKVGKSATTLDHVVPKSRGGKTDYTNCVTCCKTCNNKKADKTPAESKMKLIQKPKKPTFLTMYRHFLNNPPKEWHDYIIGLKDYENNVQ